MTDASPGPLPWEGRCRCDAVQFRIVAPPLASSACHCKGCQRMSSSAFSLTLMVPAAGVEVERGTLVPGGMRAPEAPHQMCERCGTWVMTRIDAFGVVNVRPTLLDDAGWFVPYMETYTSTKLPWVTTPAVERFEAFPDPADYPRIMADHVAWARARGWPVA